MLIVAKNLLSRWKPVPHDLVMEAGDIFGRPQGRTTVYRAVPGRVMLGFMERHLFTSSTSQHLGTITAGAAGVPL